MITKAIHTIHDRSLRGHTKIGWLDSWHTFSFSGFQDPNRMGFRSLQVINDDHLYQSPTLIVWVKNDQGFLVEGAYAYKSDSENLELHLFDTGHFALEEDVDAIADHIRHFPIAHIVEDTMLATSRK
jgi:hypothetical protein